MRQPNYLVRVPDLYLFEVLRVIIDDPLNKLQDSLKELDVGLGADVEALPKGSLAELCEHLQHEAPVLSHNLQLSERSLVPLSFLL